MADRKPFPPSPRRRALARQSGIVPVSPVLVGAMACGAVLAVLAVVGSASARTIGAWIAAASRAADGTAASRATDGTAAWVPTQLGAADGTAPPVLMPSELVNAVVALALPLLVATALAAIVAHIAQARALWIPRRRIAGAPAAPHEVRGFDVVRAVVIGGVAFGWLWSMAPRIAALPIAPIESGAWLVASALAALAIAWVALGVIDALLRHAALAESLGMTPAEKREDDRLAAADPRWRARFAASARSSPAEAVAQATVLVLGDGIAVAVAWDPARRPVPIVTAIGRDAQVTQLVALARRYRIAVHREHALATALDHEGVVGERHWPRLAEIVAAVRHA